MKVQRSVGGWYMGLRTIFEPTHGLQNLSDRHPNFLLSQTIDLLQGVLDIRPSK